MIPRSLIAPFVLLVLGLILPLLFQNAYVWSEATLMLTWATVALNWNLVFRIAGIYSFAQMIFFAAGGYTLAMLASHYGISPWIGIPAGSIVAALFGIAIGLACLRLRGAYVALLTLACTQALYTLIITDTSCFRRSGVTCVSFTGGARGLSRFADLGFRAILPYDWWQLGDYGVALALLFLSSLATALILASPLGLAFRCIRDNEQYAEARGIDRVRFQLVVFAVSAFFTGAAGSIYAAHLRVMGPNILSLDVMLFVLTMMIVGGGSTIAGPVIGAAAVYLLNEVVSSFQGWAPLAIGVTIITVVVLLPQGVVDTLASILRRNPKSRAAA